MAIYTSTLKSDGTGDYSSLAAWMSSENDNGRIAGHDHTLEIYSGTYTENFYKYISYSSGGNLTLRGMETDRADTVIDGNFYLRAPNTLVEHLTFVNTQSGSAVLSSDGIMSYTVKDCHVEATQSDCLTLKCSPWFGNGVVVQVYDTTIISTVTTGSKRLANALGGVYFENCKFQSSIKHDTYYGIYSDSNSHTNDQNVFNRCWIDSCLATRDISVDTECNSCYLTGDISGEQRDSVLTLNNCVINLDTGALGHKYSSKTDGSYTNTLQVNNCVWLSASRIDVSWWSLFTLDVGPSYVNSFLQSDLNHYNDYHTDGYSWGTAASLTTPSDWQDGNWIGAGEWPSSGYNTNITEYMDGSEATIPLKMGAGPIDFDIIGIIPLAGNPNTPVVIDCNTTSLLLAVYHSTIEYESTLAVNIDCTYIGLNQNTLDSSIRYDVNIDCNTTTLTFTINQPTVVYAMEFDFASVILTTIPQTISINASTIVECDSANLLNSTSNAQVNWFSLTTIYQTIGYGGTFNDWIDWMYQTIDISETLLDVTLLPGYHYDAFAVVVNNAQFIDSTDTGSIIIRGNNNSVISNEHVCYVPRVTYSEITFGHHLNIQANDCVVDDCIMGSMYGRMYVRSSADNFLCSNTTFEPTNQTRYITVHPHTNANIPRFVNCAYTGSLPAAEAYLDGDVIIHRSDFNGIYIRDDVDVFASSSILRGMVSLYGGNASLYLYNSTVTYKINSINSGSKVYGYNTAFLNTDWSSQFSYSHYGDYNFTTGDTFGTNNTYGDVSDYNGLIPPNIKSGLHIDPPLDNRGAVYIPITEYYNGFEAQAPYYQGSHNFSLNSDIDVNQTVLTSNVYPINVALDVDVNVNQETITYNTYPINVNISRNITVNQETITYNTYPINVNTSRNIDVNQETITYNTYPINVNISRNIDVNQETVTYNTYPINVALDVDVNVNQTELVFEINNCSVYAGVDVLITLTTDDQTFNTHQAEIKYNFDIDLNTVDQSFNTHQIEVIYDVKIQAGIASLTFNTHQMELTYDVINNLNTIDQSFNTHQAEVIYDVNVLLINNNQALTRYPLDVLVSTTINVNQVSLSLNSYPIDANLQERVINVNTSQLIITEYKILPLVDTIAYITFMVETENRTIEV